MNFDTESTLVDFLLDKDCIRGPGTGRWISFLIVAVAYLLLYSPIQNYIYAASNEEYCVEG